MNVLSYKDIIFATGLTAGGVLIAIGMPFFGGIGVALAGGVYLLSYYSQ